MRRFAALLYLILNLGLIVFQAALIAGMPWGQFAMGGVYEGVYPWPMRFVALAQIGVYGAFSAIVLVRTGLVWPHLFDLSKRLIWLVIVLGAIAVVLNLITPSVGERTIWAPVAALLLLCSLIVARSD